MDSILLIVLTQNILEIWSIILLIVLTQNIFGEMVYFLLIVLTQNNLERWSIILLIVVDKKRIIWRDGLLIINYCRHKRIINI